jgi:hypothetical protein
MPTKDRPSWLVGLHLQLEAKGIASKSKQGEVLLAFSGRSTGPVQAENVEKDGGGH